jgi:hypothetical protein
MWQSEIMVIQCSDRLMHELLPGSKPTNSAGM